MRNTVGSKMADKDKETGDKSNPGKKRERKVPSPPTRKALFFKNLFFLSLLGLVGIGLLASLSFDPQDLSDIDGYAEDSSALIPGGPDLANLLENAARNKNGVRITEEQINSYLRRTLIFEQEGWFKSFVSARGVWVRLQEDIVEVIIEREVWGKRHTISMLLQPEQTKQQDGRINTTVSRGKGKWGRTRVLNGFMLLTNSSFVSLRGAYSTETQQIWDMFRGRFQIKVSDGVLELSPPEQDLPGAPS
jgi:hypothetical protein